MDDLSGGLWVLGGAYRTEIDGRRMESTRKQLLLGLVAHHLPSRLHPSYLYPTEHTNMDQEHQKPLALAEGEPQMALPGEHLGLYHAAFPRHIVPPLMAAIVLNTRPPMYLFGWRYPYKQFLRQVINAPYLTPQEIWDHSVAEPFAEKFPHLAKYVPLLYVDPETRRCTVIIATNSDEESREMAKNEEVIEGLRPILQESREPCWYRYP